MKGAWTVRLVAVSEQDYLEVIKRSAQDFGSIQAEVYAETLIGCERSSGAEDEAWWRLPPVVFP